MATSASAPCRADEPGLVVFEAQGVKLAPGDSVDGAKPLTLDAGQTLTLIAEDGSVIKLHGPFSGAPRPAADTGNGSLSGSLAQLLTASAATSSALGASRDAASLLHPGGGGAGNSRSTPAGSIGGVTADDEIPPEGWLVSVGSSGHRCVLDNGELVFWRPDQGSLPEVPFTVSVSAANGWTGETRWPAGYTKLAAPDAMPRRDGAVYTVDAGHGPANLTLHILPGKVRAAPVLAAWMVEKGCPAQATALLRARQ